MFCGENLQKRCICEPGTDSRFQPGLSPAAGNSGRGSFPKTQILKRRKAKGQQPRGTRSLSVIRGHELLVAKIYGIKFHAVRSGVRSLTSSSNHAKAIHISLRKSNEAIY